ncbi:MAG: glycosyl transferase [Thermoleophilia bacterium]|nr:glycosyl transferase [Thermoleophilia bacterium]
MSRTIRQRRIRERRTSKRRASIFFGMIVVGALVLASAGYGAYDYLKGDEAQWPSIDTLQPELIGQNTQVFAADGSSMGYIKSDQNREILPFKEMGNWGPKATVAIEDRRFYTHDGVDWEGVARAASVNLEAGDSKEGASTITQQVVRNLYKEITVEKTLSRKAKEATLAMELEDKWTKTKILETYLNLVFYGNNAYGIQAASRTYFDTTADKLTIPQAALIAGLPQQPSRFDPFQKANAAKAKARRDDVLRAMFAQETITRTQFDAAIASPIKLTPGGDYKKRALPYFFDYVEQDLIKQFGAPTVRQGGLKVTTTINPKMQVLAQNAINDNLRDGGPLGAIAVLDTATGQIRAMASSGSYSQSKFNRPAQAKRQPGSTAKIWVLAAFLREGVNPESTSYVSRPIQVRYKGSGEAGWWKPKTYSNSYSGTTSIRSATIASDNSVFAQMTLDISPEKVHETASLMGIQSPLEDVWSIGLGSQVVTPLEQTNFYATIARGGARQDPRAVSKVVTPGGADLQLKYTKGRRVIKDWQAMSIIEILEGNVRGGTGTGAQISDEQVAGKTGTTDDAKDVWFCGMTPELTACVWMGHNIPTSMGGATGGAVPASIWRDFMDPALDLAKDRDWFVPKEEPVWVPFPGLNSWQKNPSFDVRAGADPSSVRRSAAPAASEDDAAAGDEAAAGEGTAEVPVTPTPPVTPAPVTPAPVTPAPVTPAPAPVAPASRR